MPGLLSGHALTFSLLGSQARPGSIIDEMGCCNKGNGASGFGWHSTAREVCVALGKRLDGKLVVVTGSNAGVGLETAKAFYEIGATVVMACRSEARANDAANNIRNKAVLTGKAGSIVFQPLDLTSLASVESFAAKVNAMSEPMHALVCNAGIMAGPFALTPDGFERQFQVNYLSHFYLTMLLLDKLKAAPSRVVSVSSVSHGWVPFPGGCCGGCCGLCFGSFDLSGARFPAKTGGCCAYEPFEDYS